MANVSNVAEPAPFGLLGLAMITLVVGAHQLGFIPGTTALIPWALMLGGITQVIAGKMDYKRGNVFGATAFSTYGVFWISVALLWFFTAWGKFTVDAIGLGWACVGYLIFTLYMTYGAAALNKALFCIFVAIDLVFIALLFHFFGGWGLVPSGWLHWILSALSFYTSAAIVLNQTYGKVVLPVGSPLVGKKK